MYTNNVCKEQCSVQQHRNNWNNHDLRSQNHTPKAPARKAPCIRRKSEQSPKGSRASQASRARARRTHFFVGLLQGFLSQVVSMCFCIGRVYCFFAGVGFMCHVFLGGSCSLEVFSRVVRFELACSVMFLCVLVRLDHLCAWVVFNLNLFLLGPF